MKPSDTDPYRTPSSGLDADISDNKKMQHLPRISTWYVLALNIITLGLYYPYWLYTRSMIINQVHDHKIPTNLIHSVPGILLVNIIFSFVSHSEPDNMDYQMASSLLALSYSLGTIFWSFVIRKRIHQMSDASKHSGYWLNGLLLVLFQLLYLQYKINEYIDSHSSESSLAS